MTCVHRQTTIITVNPKTVLNSESLVHRCGGSSMTACWVIEQEQKLWWFYCTIKKNTNYPQNKDERLAQNKYPTYIPYMGFWERNQGRRAACSGFGTHQQDFPSRLLGLGWSIFLNFPYNSVQVIHLLHKCCILYVLFQKAHDVTFPVNFDHLVNVVYARFLYSKIVFLL